MYAYEYVYDSDPRYSYKVSEDEIIVKYDGADGGGIINAAVDLKNNQLISIVSFEVDCKGLGVGTGLFRKLREIHQFKYCSSILCLDNFEVFWKFYNESSDPYVAIKNTPAWKIRNKCGQIKCVVSFDEFDKTLEIISEFK